MRRPARIAVLPREHARPVGKNHEKRPLNHRAGPFPTLLPGSHAGS
jgi:hypothetical protein